MKRRSRLAVTAAPCATSAWAFDPTLVRSVDPRGAAIPRFAWALLLGALGLALIATPSFGADISTKKLFIKDSGSVNKRRVVLRSTDAAIAIAEADDPATHGAAVHLYSASDDFCAVLPGGDDWQQKGKYWKYKNKTTKNVAQMGDHTLAIKLRSDVTYTLADDGGQGTVNAQVQFGTGTRYCMRCAGNRRDGGSRFLGRNCVASACDTEPSECSSATAAPTTKNIPTLACNVSQAALETATAPHLYVESNDGITRTIIANGIPDHDVGTFPNSGNPNVIAAQPYDFAMPVAPSGAGEDLTKIFGIATSGVVFDPGTAEFWNDDPNWRYEALRYATAPGYFGDNGGDDSLFHPPGLGLDCNNAHVQPNGSYHYHGVPEEMVPAPALTFLGWAGDGYPVFGRWGYVDPNDPASGLTAMTSSYRIKSGARGAGAPAGDYDGTFTADFEYVEGLGDLDECNGRIGVVTIGGSELTTYHYYVTDTYPYIPRCFHARPDDTFSVFPPPR